VSSNGLTTSQQNNTWLELLAYHLNLFTGIIFSTTTKQQAVQ
jgi:hypothetical protein